MSIVSFDNRSPLVVPLGVYVFVTSVDTYDEDTGLDNAAIENVSRERFEVNPRVHVQTPEIRGFVVVDSWMESLSYRRPSYEGNPCLEKFSGIPVCGTKWEALNEGVNFSVIILSSEFRS